MTQGKRACLPQHENDVFMPSRIKLLVMKLNTVHVLLAIMVSSIVADTMTIQPLL